MWKTILEEAKCEENWEAFLQYKIEKQHLSRQEEAEIRAYMQRKEYMTQCIAWQEHRFPEHLPEKRTINKEGSKKKRVVYSFAKEENILLKFIAFQLFRYDEFYSDNCYAFRRNYGAGDAIRRIRFAQGIGKKYCLKVDISNYFNSICVKKLLEQLSFVKENDEDLYWLFEHILLEERVTENGNIIRENHGAMAGTPISPFFANVYLTEVDKYFEKQDILYFRYSDDIILFADSMEELLERKELLYQMIEEMGLSINEDKVTITKPGESWEFIGFCYRNGEIDLSANTLRKIKARIKRKSEALRRWQRKKNLSGEKAAIGFIRTMNCKFYGKSEDSDDFTWSRWFFPYLTTDAGLKEIDAYMQQYIRYTVTGRHYKGNYRISYETLKSWGYRSLVHEYYQARNLEHGEN